MQGLQDARFPVSGTKASRLTCYRYKATRGVGFEFGGCKLFYFKASNLRVWSYKHGSLEDSIQEPRVRVRQA